MSNKWHGGKGDKPRKVDHKKFSENWERIFGKKDKSEEDMTEQQIEHKRQAELKVHNQ